MTHPDTPRSPMSETHPEGLTRLIEELNAADRFENVPKKYHTAFARFMGAVINRVEGGCICLEWKSRAGQFEGDSAWFGTNMAARIVKAARAEVK